MHLVAFSFFFLLVVWGGVSLLPHNLLSLGKSRIQLLKFLPRARGDTKSGVCRPSLRGLCEGARMDTPTYVAP